MKKLFILSALIFLFGCSSSKIVVEKSSLKSRQKLTYEDLGKAVNDADFTFAEKMADSDDQKLAVNGFKALFDGKPGDAEKYFEQTTDKEYDYRESVVLPYYFHHSMYEKCVDLAQKQDNTEYSVCEKYVGFPKTEINIGEKEIVVPIHSFNYGGTPIVEINVNGILKKFMIDTGFSHTTLSQKTADAAGIQAINAELNVIDANNKNAQSQIGYVDDLGIGALSISNQPILIMKDLSLKFMGIKMYNIDGVIGWDILQRLKVKISWKDKYIAFSKSEKRRTENNTSLSAITSSFIVLQDENGVNFYFHFDTGAQKSELFEKAESKINRKFSGKKNNISFGANSTVKSQSKVYKNISFALQDTRFRFDKILLSPNKQMSGFIAYDGRIGTDLFKNGTIEFDYGAGYIKYIE